MRTQFPISLVPYEQHKTRRPPKWQRSHLQGLLGNKRLKFGLQLACTVALFAGLLRSVSWPLLLVKLHEADAGLLLVGVVVGLSGVVVSAYQWQSLLSAEHIHIDLRRLINLYLVGIAFNHFLPTGMGGDVVKAYYIGKEGNNHSGSASAVIMSRVAGFWGMLLLSVPAVIIWHTLRNSIARPRALYVATLFGMFFHVTAALNYYSLANALHINTVPMIFYLVAVPFVSLVAFLPISFNGFGLRESAVVYIFSTLNYWQVSPEGSLVLALLMDAELLLFGLIGGCIYQTMGTWKIKTIETNVSVRARSVG